MLIKTLPLHVGVHHFISARSLLVELVIEVSSLVQIDFLILQKVPMGFPTYQFCSDSRVFESIFQRIYLGGWDLSFFTDSELVFLVLTLNTEPIVIEICVFGIDWKHIALF